MKPLVIYHGGGCTDGFGAAFAAWCKLGDDAEYVPMHYGDPLPPIDGRAVYVLDFSFPRQETELLCSDTASFVWLDHHKTAFEMWCQDGECNRCEQGGGYSYILLDNNKSGALLAWEYFHPEKDVPYLISRIDDRDRWVFKLHDSKALHAGLQLRKPWVFKEWAQLVPAMGGSSTNLAKVIGEGNTALKVYDEQIKQSVRKAERCTLFYRDFDAKPVQTADDEAILCFEGLAVNTPNNISEVGNELAKASGSYGLVWYHDGATGRANCSLRSIGEYDVSAIAKAFGGGGHRNAAGFNIDMSTLLGWLK